MSQKIIKIKNVGEVVMSKRRGAKQVRLSVSHDGEVRLSMPKWTPFSVGESFILQKLPWILSQKANQKPNVLLDGARIGKAHRLIILFSDTPSAKTRVNSTEVRVTLPSEANLYSKQSQQIIKKACLKALRMESERLLIQRTNHLAKSHGFSFKSVSIKQLKSRWGSCSHQRDIVLSCFLIQLPWTLIDYVIFHELVHTQVMAHGPKFWREVTKYVLNLKDCRAEIKKYKSVVMTQN